jgi:hypothetical protein
MELILQRKRRIGTDDKSVGLNLRINGFEASMVLTRDGEMLENETTNANQMVNLSKKKLCNQFYETHWNLFQKR